MKAVETQKIHLAWAVQGENYLWDIRSNNGLKLQDRFDMNFEGLLSFRKWLLDHSIQKLAVESTAITGNQIHLIERI